MSPEGRTSCEQAGTEDISTMGNGRKMEGGHTTRAGQVHQERSST